VAARCLASVPGGQNRGDGMTNPINSDDPGAVAAEQAAAEAGAQQWADYYQHNDGVTVGTTGHAQEPLAVAGDANITGVPWDQQS
jgi:hypothetical protein